MTQNPRVALFEPSTNETEGLLALFKKHDFVVRVILRPLDLMTLAKEEGQAFEAAVVPIQLSDGTNGISVCLQIKSEPTLSSIPVIGLSTSRDTALLEAFYGAGADLVFTAPFDMEHIRLQIVALTRQKRSFDELIRSHQAHVGLRESTVNALNTIREGLVMVDHEYRPIFANLSARSMLGLTENWEHDLGKTGEQFRSWAKHHRQNRTDQSDRRPSLLNVRANRLDGNSFRAEVRITDLFDEDARAIGYAFALADLSEIYQLYSALVQGQRTRSLCLSTAAACLRLVKSTQFAAYTSPLARVVELLEREPRECSLGIVVTALTETVDLLVSPSVSLKVDIRGNWNLKVTFPDLFQLLGHILLHAIEYAGLTGEVRMHAVETEDPNELAILVSARNRRVTPLLPNDNLSRLIEGKFAEVVDEPGEQSKLGFGLGAAQAIAPRYNTKVEYRELSDTEMELRVLLPILTGT